MGSAAGDTGSARRGASLRDTALRAAGLAALLFLAGSALYFMPGGLRVRLEDRRTGKTRACQANLRQIATGCLMYLCDWGETFPPAGNREPRLLVYVPKPSTYACPAARRAEPSYAYNHNLDGGCLGLLIQPGSTCLAWDAGARVPSWTPPLGARTGRHQRGDNLAYTDGHVQWLPSGAPVGRTAGARLRTPSSPAGSAATR